MNNKKIINFIFYTFFAITIAFALYTFHFQHGQKVNESTFQSPLIKVEVPFSIYADGKELTDIKLKDKNLLFNGKTNEVTFKFKLPYYEKLKDFIPFMFFKAANYEVKVSIDDQVIFTRRYQTDTLRPFQTYEGVAINFIELPKDYQDKEITISLRNPVKEMDSYRIRTVYLGNESTIRLYALSYGFSNMLFGIMLLIISFVIFSLLFINRKSRNFNLISIALFIANLGIWLVTQSHAKFIFTDNSAVLIAASYMSLFCLPPYTIFMLNSYYSFEKNKFYKVLENISLYSLLFLGCVYLLDAVTTFSIQNLLSLYGAYALCFELFITIYLIYIKWKNNNSTLTNPILALICILFSIVIDELLFIEGSKLSSNTSFFFLYCPYLLSTFILIKDVIKIYIQEKQTAAAKEILYNIYSKDSLSGAYSRSYFETNLENKRIKIPYQSIIFFVDIDNMKMINDKEGHASGDLLIKSMGQAVNAVFEAQHFNNLFIRYGGDEFLIIIFPSDTNFDKELFSSRIEENFQFYSLNKTTLSIGYSCKEENRTVEECIKLADKMMLDEKNLKKQDLLNN